MSFHNQCNSKTGVLEIHATVSVEPSQQNSASGLGGGVVEGEEEDEGEQRPGSRYRNMRIPWDKLGETVIPWSACGRGSITSQGTNVTVLPSPLAEGHRHTH